MPPAQFKNRSSFLIMTPVAMDLTQENIREYQVCHTFDRDFINCLNRLHRQYGDDVFEVLGIANRNLDIARFSEEFFSKASANVADVSVDDNANVSEKNISHYESESTKALQKLNSLATMYLWVKKCFSKKDADIALEKTLNGEVFISDLTSWQKPYCFAFDLRNMLYEGMSFFKGNFKIHPPKRTSSFVAQLIQTIAYISNHIKGASAFPDALIAWDFFLRKEYGSDYMQKIKEDTEMYSEVTNQFQNFIYSVNYPFRAGGQSAFTNLSVLDRGFMKSLFTKEGVSGRDYVFPDGTTVDVESAIALSKFFFEYYTEINSKEGIFTFPVMTLAISKDDNGNFVDPEFVEWVSKANSEKCLGNVFINKPTSFSSCCFTGSQKVLTKDFRGVKLLSFSDFYQSDWTSVKHNLTVFHNGSWVKANPVKVKNPSQKLLKITTANNKEVVVTPDHIFPTLAGDKACADITENDFLMFSSVPLDTYAEKDMKLTYEQGVFIGAYLGGGSVSIQEPSEENVRRQTYYQTNFSLNEVKYHTLIPLFEKALLQWGISRNLSLATPYNNVYPVSIGGEDIVNKIKYWVSGCYAWEKELNIQCLLQSREFRKGIVDGYYITDGGNSNRIYSTSFKLIEQMESVFTSLGIPTTIDSSDRRDEPVIIREREFKRNHILHCIRWYAPGNKRSMGDVFVLRNNCLYFKVKKIEEISSEEDVYCFTVKNEQEPYFTLPNGIISHNCRLLNNFDNLSGIGYTNSFGVGTLSVGSHQVAGVNLPRLALLEKENPDIFEEILNATYKILTAHRKMLEESILLGTMPLYTSNWINLKRQYSTVGFVGMHEYLKNKGLNPVEESSILEGLKLLKKIEEKMILWQKESNCTFNLEQIPAESFAVRLAKLDSLLGYNPNQFPMYSNQYLPLWEEASIYDRFKLQGKFDSHTTGGAILHINVQDNKPLSSVQFKALLEQARTSGTVYFAINLAFSECEERHYSIGQQEICPVCKKKIVNQYTRVVGYLSKVSAWNKTRRTYDYPNRHFYTNGKLAALEGEKEEKTVES